MIKNFINKYENFIICFIGIFLLCNIFIVRYFTMGSSAPLMAIYPIIFLFLIFKMDFSKITKFQISVAIIYLVYIIINISINGFWGSGAIKSLLFVNRTFIIYLFAIYLVNEKEDLTKKIVYKYLFYILNIYFILNIPLLILQAFKIGFMNHKFLEANILYADHVTGLIGISGTHVLSFYWIALMYINLLIYMKSKNKWFGAYIIFQMLFMLIIATYSDNTAFYILFPLFLVQFFLKDIKQIKKIFSFKGILIIVLCIGVIAGFYYNSESTRRFLDERVKVKIQQYTSVSNISGEEYGDERIMLFNYILGFDEAYKLGKGIGRIEQYGDSRMPPHFGMNELPIRTYEGGLTYTILLLLINSMFLADIINLKRKPKWQNVIKDIIILFDMILLATYTEIFTDQFKIIFLAIMAITLYFRYSEESNNGDVKCKEIE